MTMALVTPMCDFTHTLPSDAMREKPHVRCARQILLLAADRLEPRFRVRKPAREPRVCRTKWGISLRTAGFPLRKTLGIRDAALLKG